MISSLRIRNEFLILLWRPHHAVAGGSRGSNPGQRVAVYNHLAAPGPVTIVTDTQVDIDFVDISSPPF